MVKVFERLAVTAKLDFDETFKLMQKHKKELIDITNKHFSPIFNKFSVPLFKPADAYEALSCNIFGDACNCSYPQTVYFSFNEDYGMYGTSFSYIIEEKGKTGIRLNLNCGETSDFNDVKKLLKILAPVNSISQKDFDSAYKKAKAEMEKALDKWTKE